MLIIKKMAILCRKVLVSFVQSRIVQKTMLGSMNMLARFVRRDPKIVLCGAMNGRWYGDNSKYVYEWILENRPDLKPVWLTNSDGVYSALINEQKPVVRIKSLKGFCYLLRAEVGIFTNSLYDLSYRPYLIPSHMKLIALRHGRSVKRIRFARKGHKISEKEATERHLESNLISYAISTSEFVSDIQEECLKIGRHKHVVTGYPRNDFLWAPPDDERDAWLKFVGDSADKKIILYAPSWRHGREATRFFPFDDFDADVLVDYLENRDVMLMLRPHANDLKKYPELVSFLVKLAGMSHNIRMATHVEFPDVNSLLPFVDVLISDYSALYHDYLLLNRPMLFVPYDYDDFSKQNGFLYDYKSMLPGAWIDTLDKFRYEIDQLLSGTDSYKTARSELVNMVHQYKDNGASRRVINLIDRIIER